MTDRPCRACGATERYTNGKCKPCHRRSTKESRQRNVDAWRARQQRYRANQSSEQRAKLTAISRVAGAASKAVQRAVKRGQLVRPDRCEACGRTGPVQGAHYDYRRPLEVRWLCASCHATWDHEVPKAQIDPWTVPSFERIGNAKVTQEIAERMRAEYQPGVVGQAELGRRYGVTQSHVSQILRGTHWTARDSS